MAAAASRVGASLAERWRLRGGTLRCMQCGDVTTRYPNLVADELARHVLSRLPSYLCTAVLHVNKKTGFAGGPTRSRLSDGTTGTYLPRLNLCLSSRPLGGLLGLVLSQSGIPTSTNICAIRTRVSVYQVVDTPCRCTWRCVDVSYHVMVCGRRARGGISPCALE